MSIMVFTPFERQQLKLASKEAQSVAKSAKAAAKKAYLSQGESEAHELMGYAEEAVRFLDAPDGPNGDEVQLSFGHRSALRTGCLILIDDIDGIADEQTDFLVDADGISATRKRAEDYRRLEARLRTIDNPQQDLPLDGANTPPAPSDEGAAAAAATVEPDADGPIVGEGPFDAEGVRERLALPAPQPDLDPDIADAEFEVLDGDPSDPASDAWLNEPLRADATNTTEREAMLDETEREITDEDLSPVGDADADDAAIDDDAPAATET